MKVLFGNVAHAAPLCGEERKVVIVEKEIHLLYGKPLADAIRSELIVIEGKEAGKSGEEAFFLISTLVQRGVTRDCLLIGMGGGATTDLVAFVSSIYLRGVPFVLIPTTLLGCVDAAIGGKTAINLPSGKNLVGSFAHPQSILIDFGLLRSLPEKEWVNGLAEMWKLGLVSDRSLWGCSISEASIKKAIEGKLRVVEQDPEERGPRRILNFGHTVGHALESATFYSLSHGQAVAFGCLAESYLSARLGRLPLEQWEEIESVYRQFPWNIPQKYNREVFLQSIRCDKKKGKEGIRFTLIDQIGHAAPFEGDYCHAVSPFDFQELLYWIENTWRQISSETSLGSPLLENLMEKEWVSSLMDVPQDSFSKKRR